MRAWIEEKAAQARGAAALPNQSTAPSAQAARGRNVRSLRGTRMALACLVGKRGAIPDPARRPGRREDIEPAFCEGAASERHTLSPVVIGQTVQKSARTQRSA